MSIVHISTDYPDAYNAAKTRAIKNLVEATRDDHEHVVYSLNRTEISPITAVLRRIVPGTDAAAITDVGYSEEIVTWRYDAPAKSIMLRTAMEAVADRIANDISRRGIHASLVQGHKLSMEGIAAFRVAHKLGIPFALSIQGNSDRNITKVRRDLWTLYKRIFHEAAIVFPFSPWALRYLESIFGKRDAPTFLLPCITAQDRIIEPKATPNRIISAFHLRNWQLKNLPSLVRGAEFLSTEFTDFNIDVYGGGDPIDVETARKCLDEGSSDSITLMGAIRGNQIQQEMNNSAGLAMISHKESFGMVFIEALLAGAPVVYPKDAAIDGYFDDYSFAIAAPATNQEAINDGLARLLRDQESLKADLRQWQKSPEASHFQKTQIAHRYSTGLEAAIKVN